MLIGADKLASLIEVEGVDPLLIVPRPDVQELRAGGASSIDLRLGTWFLSLRQARLSHLKVDSELEPGSIGSEHEARIGRKQYVPFGDEFYLHPRSFVLGVTLEWIRLPKNLAGYVIGKSSWGRRGLIIATASGVHAGFAGCLTLELSNVGELPITIQPGMPICQLFLHKVDTAGDKCDVSRYLGLRQPVVGRMTLDEFAIKLARKDPEEADGSPAS